MDCAKRNLPPCTGRTRTKKSIPLFVWLVALLSLLCKIDDPKLSTSLHCYAFTAPFMIRPRVNCKRRDMVGLLHSEKKTKKDDNEVGTNTDIRSDGNETTRVSRVDPLLVYTDVFAIVIACQLLGLLDVLNDATFWMNGGWFQPITPVLTASTTLPIFLQRAGINSVCYTFITFVFVKGSYETSTALRSPNSILRMMISSIMTFTVARLFAVVVGSLVVTPPVSAADCIGLVMSHTDQITEILRESYFVAITVTTGRVGLNKLFNLS